MPVNEANHVITKIGAYERRLAVGRPRTKDHDLGWHGIELNRDFAPVNLKLMAWLMVDGNEDHWRYEFASDLFIEIADGASSALILMFVTESLSDSDRGVSLFSRLHEIIEKASANGLKIRFQFRLSLWRIEPIGSRC